MDFWIVVGESNSMKNPAVAVGFFCVDLFIDKLDGSTRGYHWTNSEEE